MGGGQRRKGGLLLSFCSGAGVQKKGEASKKIKREGLESKPPR